MSSTFPVSLDTDTTLPPVNNNITEIGEDAINALRDAVFNIETNIGVSAQGSMPSIAALLSVSLNPNGTINPAAISGLGLVVLPITNVQVGTNAAILESKLALDHKTQDLYNQIVNLSSSVGVANGWIAVSGVKLEPHLAGLIYRHTLSQIDVASDPTTFLHNKFNALRDNSNAFNVLNDLNSEMLAHQWADGTPASGVSNVTTVGGSTYPSNYGHTASGIYLNPSRFSVIPQTANDLQQFADYVDNSSLFLLGSRIQNLFSNGISNSSSSSALTTDGYGQQLVPYTAAITYLLDTGSGSSPVDDINMGDDIIQFTPASSVTSNNAFDAQFALVKVGDLAYVNYGSVLVSFLIKEKKYIQSGGIKSFYIRIAGKNLFYNAAAQVAIYSPLFNNNKPGVLSLSQANNPIAGSLIVGAPSGAQIVGNGFNPEQIDENHYLLYLVLYPNGTPSSGIVLPVIDISGNSGTTPGNYSLENVISATNDAFRQPGYNYRFVAFKSNGSFGIMLADSYNNVGFSIVSGTVDANGSYDQTLTQSTYPDNVLDLFPVTGENGADPLGLAALASPIFQASYASPQQALIPTQIFLPLKNNNFYVNGVEKERLNLDVLQSLDTYGDGFWTATVQNQTFFPSPGRVQNTYRVHLNLSTSGLKVGKTIVVQSLSQGGTIVDFGRFVISNIVFNLDCATSLQYTDITVYDAVHGAGLSPQTSVLAVGSVVALYFNADSVAFNTESSTDVTVITPFKRHFEVYVDQNGSTFTHERARINISGSTLLVNNTVPLYTGAGIANLNIIRVSSKLRGFQFGAVTKITLNILGYSNVTGVFSGYLAFYNGSSFSSQGALTVGRIGQIVRFYDQSNIDFIDIFFDPNGNATIFSNQTIDFQLFPSLDQDGEIMQIGTAQFNDINDTVSYVEDTRQFGNISQEDFSTSALDFISIPQKYLHANGVIRGLDVISTVNGGSFAEMLITGGVALVNGKFIQINPSTVSFAAVQENYNLTFYNINWAVCINDQGEIINIPLLDYDVSVPTPNAPARLLNAYNAYNGNTYNIDANIFSDIVNLRRDLAILYVVTTTVTAGSPPTVAVSYSDARRFLNDAEGNYPLKFTSVSAQGNFRSLTSIFSWLKFNNLYNGTAIVKGATATNSTISAPVSLNFPAGTVVIDGQNDATIVLNGLLTLGSNVVLQNLTLIINGGISVLSGASNITFNNCNLTINQLSTPALNNTFLFTAGSNISFNNCIINVVYSLVSTTATGAVFQVNGTSGFSMQGTSISATFATVPGTYPPGNIVNLVSCNNSTFTNCIFSGNFNQAVGANSSNLSIHGGSISSTYNPFSYGAGDTYNGVTYATANLVNSGQGYIYIGFGSIGAVPSLISGISIQNVVFNYSSTVSGLTVDRYSFINIELPNNNSVIQNLRITGCQFNSNNLAISQPGYRSDYRAAIAIINTAPQPLTNGSSSNSQPILSSALIENNVCDLGQLILLTSVSYPNFETGLPFMELPALNCINCCISNNICGAIGYLTGSGTKLVAVYPYIGTGNDKISGLTISGNSCYYIANMDHKGQYFLISKISVALNTTVTNVNFTTGNVIIDGNQTSWIHVGTNPSLVERSYLKISNNVLCAYDGSILTAYNDTNPNATFNPNYPLVALSSGYAIYVNSIATSSYFGETYYPNDTPCVISGNSIQAGIYNLPGSTISQYYYQNGYIYTQSSAHITDNTCHGIAESSSNAYLFLLGGQNHTVTGNMIYRDNTSIASYVGYAQMQLPFVTGSAPTGTLPTGQGSTGIVHGNFFDDGNNSGTYGQQQNPDLIQIASDPYLGNPPLFATAAKQWIVSNNINQSKNTQVLLAESISTWSTLNNQSGFVIDTDTGAGSRLPTRGLSIPLTTSYPSNTQQYSIYFNLSNHIPYTGAKLCSLILKATNRSSNPVTFNNSSITMSVFNSQIMANNQLVAITSVSSTSIETTLGPANATFSLTLNSSATNIGATGAILPLDYPLEAGIIVFVNISISAKYTGTPSVEPYADVLVISPLLVQTVW